MVGAEGQRLEDGGCRTRTRRRRGGAPEFAPRRPYSTAVEDFPHLSRFALELESLPAMSALFPGYTQVEAFGPDEDYESNNGEVEEEVEYVTLDLGTVEPTLVPSSSSYRLIVSGMYTLLLHSC